MDQLMPLYLEGDPRWGGDVPNDRRVNRLCVCVSDLHFTDGTVGVQSAGAWGMFFADLVEKCRQEKVKELVVVLDGDIVDFIRSGQWVKAGIYPWQREDPRFPEVLRRIMDRIIRLHNASPNDSHYQQADWNGHCGFFSFIRQINTLSPRKGEAKPPIPQGLGLELYRAGVERVDTLVLLGNHDKELLADEQVLADFYTHCLGIAPQDLTDEYRDWVARMYNRPDFRSPDLVPWLPFYHADRGFHLFTTHGQWRDPANSAAFPECAGRRGWQAQDGWQPHIWEELNYAPFREPCFGDTVAAGLLSSFICKTKEALQRIGYGGSAAAHLDQILDELDLYRPASAALTRILEETASLRGPGHSRDDADAARIIEEQLLLWLETWMDWPFTLESLPAWKCLFRLGRSLLHVFGHDLTIRCLRRILLCVEDCFPGLDREGVTMEDLITFPAFLPDYRHYGFRIHGEGHTHHPLEADPNLGDRKNYTYINYGCWRDRILPKEGWPGQRQAYRRRTVGRALYVFDLRPDPEAHHHAPAADDAEACIHLAAPAPREAATARRFFYRTEDLLAWGGRRDSF